MRGAANDSISGSKGKAEEQKGFRHASTNELRERWSEHGENGQTYKSDDLGGVGVL